MSSSSRALFVFFATLASVTATSAAERPNILFIVADDMEYADVGFHDCRDIPTPNVDALSAAGVRCTDGYVSGPYCSPTRAGLMTARYQTRFGHEFNPSGADGMPTTETTIADRLKKAGYVTGLVGKWHLGSAPQFHPQKRGFVEFFGFLEGAHDYFRTNGVMRGESPADEKEYLTDAFGREAVSFIDRHQGETWFLCLTFNAVHTPMQADDPRLQKFASIENKTRRTYAAMLSALDDNVGRVRQKLAETKQEQNTLVVFFSDNGGPTMPGVTVNGSSNLPLRGSKRTTLEGGIRVPFIVSWPAKLQPGVYEQPVIQLDVSATALVAAGIELRSDWKLDGVDLMPYLTAQKAGIPHEVLYWRFGEQMAIRVGEYKLVRYDTNFDTRTGDRRQPVSAARLYRLTEDLGEKEDLAKDMPDKLRELQTRWDQWNATLAEPLWKGGKGDGDGGEKSKKDDKPRKKKKAKAE